MQNIKYFTLDNLSCRCCGVAHMNMDFLIKLDKVRHNVGKPFVVTSGFRCEEHNKRVRGRVKSLHKVGRAVDFDIIGWSNEDIMRLVYFAGKFGLRVRVYARHLTGAYVFCHIDSAVHERLVRYETMY